ncbi:hypothetical protein [uncultured Vagococcus sp.]|uniref:hypothetical protein n=1 Tax=uncultured Vagococcus sp. TaxID=189676 RepID=UPI0028D0C6C2|nr:hypothetical protein [uncultured Vagococcus sp.]
MRKIASNTGAATVAVAGIKSVTINNGQQVSLVLVQELLRLVRWWVLLFFLR